MEREGHPLGPNEEVDHIWPKDLGGADHRWNYQVLPKDQNRSLGASVLPKLEEKPLEVALGLAVSVLSALICIGD